MTLTTRLAIAMILLVAIAVTAVGWLSYRDLEQSFLPRVLDRVETHSRLVAAELESTTRSVTGDIIIFRDLAAVVGLMRARLNDGIDPVDGTMETLWRERLTSRLSALLAIKPNYERMQFIGVEDGGREIGRVERSAPNGALRSASGNELRRLGEARWFQDAVKRAPNEIYVFRIELNQENAEGGPGVPTLRAATTISSAGNVYGIVVIDVNMAAALDRVRNSPRPGEIAYVVDAQGGYLVHPDRSREFAWQKGATSDWTRDWPDLAPLRGSSESTVRAVPDGSGNPDSVAFAPVVLAGSQWVAMIEKAPNAAFMAPAAAIRNSALVVGLIAVLCAAAMAMLIARSLIGPIVKLTAAVEHAGANGASAIPVDAGGETGVLARAFARVIGEANAKTLELEREVAEHRRTEAARDHHAERERLFSAAFESSNDAVITMSLDGTITGWNSAAQRLYGYAAAEAVGKNIDLIIPAERRSEVADALRRISWGEKIEQNETVRRRKDGSLVEVSLGISPIKAPSGETIGITKTARDITETNRTQLALRQQTEERRRIFETSQDLILIADSRGTLIQVSPSSRTILGYWPEEMIGRSAADFIHPGDLEAGRNAMRIARHGGKTQIPNLRYFHKDGRIVAMSWLGAWSEPVRRHFFVARDMTDSLQAQEILRESEQLARGIIETALDAFVQTDESFRVTDWNSQAEKIFGWTRSDVIGRKLIDLIVPERLRDAYRAELENFLVTGTSRMLGRQFVTDALRRDGEEIKVELSITEMKRRDGIVFNGFIRDLTDKIAAEDRLRHAEKMEAVGQLTGGIAHDFNNILTVITGTIEILAEAVADKPQLAAITRMIDDAASRGAELTQHLLAFARKQPLQPRETDVNTLIIDTAKLLRATLGEQVEIESVFEDEVSIATVDPSQLATALLNLALNARDAMPNGGKLILETCLVMLDDNYARNNDDVRPGSYILIAVSDTGIGIPADIIDKVFDPFFTSKGPGEGTGLGLSMVYGFVKQSAGHIKIYSEEGHGTTIKMYLPLGTGTAVAPEPSVQAVQGGHEVILVVEDDKLVRDYVLAQLHSLGYVTLDAANAGEALALVDAGTHFDLLFTDVIMPGRMNGRQLADEVARRRPGAKVLFTSGYTENAIIHHGRLDAGVLLLAKPYRKSDLASMIRKALGGAA